MRWWWVGAWWWCHGWLHLNVFLSDDEVHNCKAYTDGCASQFLFIFLEGGGGSSFDVVSRDSADNVQCFDGIKIWFIWKSGRPIINGVVMRATGFIWLILFYFIFLFLKKSWGVKLVKEIERSAYYEDSMCDLDWVRVVDDDTGCTASMLWISKVFNCLKVANDHWELLSRKVEVCVMVNWEKEARCSHLVQVSADRIIWVPFCIRSHEEVMGVNLEDAT